MEMLQATLAALVLVGLAVVTHYESLRAISIFTSKLTIPHRALSMVVISGVLLAHFVEICLFAAGFFVMHAYLGLGSVKGEFNGSLLDYFYFSATTYSTLGVGDLFPTGVIRLVAGVEALTGFVLIGWSASFTYLSMQRSWIRRKQHCGNLGWRKEPWHLGNDLQDFTKHLLRGKAFQFARSCGASIQVAASRRSGFGMLSLRSTLLSFSLSSRRRSPSGLDGSKRSTL